jgi:flagellar basal body-associated protein FliL
MAEGEGERTAPERSRRKGGARRVILTFLPLALIALVVAKLTILEPPPAPAVVAARAAVRQYELDTKCALANGVNPPRAPAAGGTAGASGSPTTTAAPAATGPTLDLDSKTMNLDGAHYLKVGVSLQLPAKAVVDDVKTTENWGSIASQLVLDTFSGRSFAELSKDGVRERLQHTIGYQTCERTGGKVATVYFVDFVMQ